MSMRRLTAPGPAADNWSVIYAHEIGQWIILAGG